MLLITLLQSSLFPEMGVNSNLQNDKTHILAMKRNLENDKLVMKIIRKQTCKMITQDYDKLISYDEKTRKWPKMINHFLGKICISGSGVVVQVMPNTRNQSNHLETIQE